MAKTADNRLADLTTRVEAGSPERARARRAAPGLLASRKPAFEALASGSRRSVVLHRVAPERCRMWSGHNRDYAALGVEACADLIDGFRESEQIVPAVGRQLAPGDTHDIELIVGARRHWTAAHLGRDLVVEIRDLDDRTAFIVQDVENRHRRDVSDLERARDYLRALPLHFGNEAAQMASVLQLDPTGLSRLLSLARLPDAIVRAYRDPRELVVHHGTVLRKLMKDDRAKQRILAAADTLRAQGGAPGKQVIAALARAATTAVEKPPPRSVGAASVAAQTRRQLTMKLQLPAERTPERLAELEADLVALVREALGSATP